MNREEYKDKTREELLDEIEELIERNEDLVDTQSEEDHLSDTEEMVDKYYNLRNFIGRNRGQLCIFGEKMLKSKIFPQGNSIVYDNIERESYNDPVNFEETTLSELEYGDVFVLEEHIYTENCSDVDIYIGEDINSYYRGQYLKHGYGIERIRDSSYINGNTKVIKALRY